MWPQLDRSFIVPSCWLETKLDDRTDNSLSIAKYVESQINILLLISFPRISYRILFRTLNSNFSSISCNRRCISLARNSKEHDPLQ
ncbi:hypothetical protein M2408_002308 [Sphingobacterium sp. BIGb0165]|nr:hypothetical protein [Sphingobacterium sp. BIGb0165]